MSQQRPRLTYGGNPVCCPAALATLELVEREFARNAAEVGAYLIDRLRELQDRYQVIGDVRGMGLMIGIELVTDRLSRTPAHDLCAEVLHRGHHKGMILLSCSAQHSPIHATPVDREA